VKRDAMFRENHALVRQTFFTTIEIDRANSLLIKTFLFSESS